MSRIKMTDYVTTAFKTAGTGLYHMDCIDTYYGTVGIAATMSSTFMCFVRDGMDYQRRWDRGWHRRTLPRLAHRFAADVVEGRV